MDTNNSTTVTRGTIVTVKSGKLARVSCDPYTDRMGGQSVSYRNLRDGEVYGPSRYASVDSLTVVD